MLDWWRRDAVYHVYPRSFADADGDGVGDLAGVTARLDHLVELGVGAVWLSPFFRSPMADFGYDVADHRDVDPLFGTLDDADALVAAAHERDLRVVIDFVPNHTSDRHPWFVESRSSRSSPRRDWYVWRDRPNGWRTQFTRDQRAWTLDERTGQWYLHSFLPEQPDLNWDNPEVEAAMHDVVRFWLERGVDGLRIDVVYRIAKDPELGENDPGGRRHDQDWPSIHPRLRALRRLLDEHGAMAVGELYLPSQRELAAYVTSGDELQLVHNFFLLAQSWDAAAFRATIDEWVDLLGDDAWPAWCLGNHDHPRIATRYGPERARLVALLLLTLRGTPFIFQGDELGLPDATIPDDRVVDVDGRDPQRAPLPWEPPSRAGAGAGFTAGEPWLPVVDDAETLNVETQARDRASMLWLYRDLLALRRRERALQDGTQAWVDAGAEVLAYLREHDGVRLLVVLNFADAPRPAALVGVDSPAHVALATAAAGAHAPETRLATTELELAANEGLVLVLDPPRRIS